MPTMMASFPRMNSAPHLWLQNCLKMCRRKCLIELIRTRTRSCSMKNSVSLQSTNPVHHFSHPSEHRWSNRFEVLFSNLNRQLPPRQHLHPSCPIPHRNRYAPHNRCPVGDIVRVFPVCIMSCKQESFVEVATLVLNTTGDIAPYAVLAFD